MLISLHRIVLYTYFACNYAQRLICLLDTLGLLTLKCVCKLNVFGPKMYNILDLFNKESHDGQLVGEFLFRLCEYLYLPAF